MAYKQKNNPFSVTSCGRRRSYMTTDSPTPFYQKEKEEFKAHDMYDKQHADTLAKHLKLKKEGYKPNPDGRPAKESGSCVPVKMRKTTKGKNRTFRTSEEGAGMTSKGVAAYKRENPGSKLKTAVTGKVKPGSKAAGRRKSFCARSKGWTGERGKAARARWKC